MVLDAFVILLTHLKSPIFIKSLTMLWFLSHIRKGTNGSGCSKTNKTNLHAKPTGVISMYKQQPSVFNSLLHFRSKRVNRLAYSPMTHVMMTPQHVNKAMGVSKDCPLHHAAADLQPALHRMAALTVAVSSGTACTSGWHLWLALCYCYLLVAWQWATTEKPSCSQM